VARVLSVVDVRQNARMGRLAVVGYLPAAPGVYRFRDGHGRVLYIGRATDLRARVGSYWGDLRDRPHLYRMVARVARVEAAVCDSVHEAAWLERNLLERSVPRWNRIAGGTESPVYLRLDTGAARPGLVVAHCRHDGPEGRWYGPYLGGLKVRTAVSALHRVLPLPYATDALSGAERDMARARAVLPAERAGLADRIAAVLDRDRAAVGWARAELLRRRAEAAGVLAFELAARVHEELDALDWVTCAQNAALLEPATADVYGWADGVLVHFAVRAGRMSGWTRRACTRRRAEPLVASTPQRWADFARRNAELAARGVGSY
jgi:excinuclease ABC subunit C